VELRGQLGGHLEASVSGGISGRRLALGFAAALAVSSVPLFSTILPPLLDYPNHLARMALLAGGPDAALGAYYRVDWAPLPDLAMDLIVPVLSRAMPLELAGKLFILMIFALLAGGTVWLNRALHGRWHWWPLAAFLLLYSRTLLWGFLNYLFGLGLMLGALALWLQLERRPVSRAVASSIAALAIYLSHLSAFGVYALALAGIEAPALAALARQRAWPPVVRRLAVAGPQFVAPALLLIFWRHGASGPLAFNIARKPDLLFSIFDNYDRRFDATCFALFLLLLIGLAATRRLGPAPVLRLPLMLVTLAYLVMPSQLFGASGADHRLPVALFLLLIAGSAPAWPSWLVAQVALSSLTLLFLLRLAVIERVWLRSDQIYRDDLAALDLLPEGASLALAAPPRTVQAGGIPALHLPVLAIARRHAFVPTLFAYAGQQPVALNQEGSALAAKDDTAALWAALTEPGGALPTALKSYDFVVLVDQNPFTVPAHDCLAPIRLNPSFQLFAIKPDCPEWR
jgi:hypothetical protein